MNDQQIVPAVNQGRHKHVHGLELEYECTAPDKEACIALEWELDKVMLDAANVHIDNQGKKVN